MNTFKKIIALSVLFIATALVAEEITQAFMLDDGVTQIQAGYTQTIGTDGTVQYTDADGKIVAQVKEVTNAAGVTTVTILRKSTSSRSGWETVAVVNGSVGQPQSTGAPTPVTELSGSGPVGGSGATQGPTGAPQNSAVSPSQLIV